MNSRTTKGRLSTISVPDFFVIVLTIQMRNEWNGTLLNSLTVTKPEEDPTTRTMGRKSKAGQTMTMKVSQQAVLFPGGTKYQD